MSFFYNKYSFFELIVHFSILKQSQNQKRGSICHLSLVVWSYESGILESIDSQVRNSVGSLFSSLRSSRQDHACRKQDCGWVRQALVFEKTSVGQELVNAHQHNPHIVAPQLHALAYNHDFIERISNLLQRAFLLLHLLFIRQFVR